MGRGHGHWPVRPSTRRHELIESRAPSDGVEAQPYDVSGSFDLCEGDLTIFSHQSALDQHFPVLHQLPVSSPSYPSSRGTATQPTAHGAYFVGEDDRCGAPTLIRGMLRPRQAYDHTSDGVRLRSRIDQEAVDYEMEKGFLMEDPHAMNGTWR